MALVEYGKKDKQDKQDKQGKAVQVFHKEIYTDGCKRVIKSFSYIRTFNQCEKDPVVDKATQISREDYVGKSTIPNKQRQSGKNKIFWYNKKIKKDLKDDPKMVKQKSYMTGNVLETTQRKAPQKSRIGNPLMVLVLSFSVVLVAYFYIKNRENNFTWDLVKTNDDLIKNVFGQDEQISKINSILKLCTVSKGLYTVLLTGGVGVGKSYTSGIISQNFPWSSNWLILKHSTRGKLIDSLPKSLKEYRHYLIRVDDLSVDDTAEAIHLVSEIRKRIQDQHTLLFLIFNTGCEVQKKKILIQFKNSHIFFYHIPFQNLTRNDVEKCFLNEIKKQGALISSEEIENLITNQVKDIDIVRGPIGCKGITDKILHYSRNK
ncbi:hypothetical protein RUM44_013817 [Polyplax serrata]|uniref:Uncharacterized protein n=1 Tax=Polyplax serrata TaxID=468196 RepID=A0ABR1BH44_POLSC